MVQVRTSNGDNLLTTLNSLKSSPMIPKTSFPEMDLVLAKTINSLPIKIEDHLASGVTQKSRILTHLRDFLYSKS